MRNLHATKITHTTQLFISNFSSNKFVFLMKWERSCFLLDYYWTKSLSHARYPMSVCVCICCLFCVARSMRTRHIFLFHNTLAGNNNNQNEINQRKNLYRNTLAHTCRGIKESKIASVVAVKWHRANRTTANRINSEHSLRARVPNVIQTGTT